MGFDGPRATPSVAGDRVIALSGSGLLAAVDRATGRRLWAVDLQGEVHGARPQWGYAGSPLVSDGKVFVSAGGRAGLLALSVADGHVLWHREGWPAAGYASALRTTLAGHDQVVFFTGDGVVGVQPDEGAVLWSFPWQTDLRVNAATPLVLGSNRLFVASAYGFGAASLLVDEHGHASELWHTKKMKNKTATSVLYEGNLYGFNEDRLTCLDAKTGEERWSHEGYGRGTLLLAEGHLFVQTEDCRHLVVEATPVEHRQVGEIARVLHEQSECWSTPAIADGILYVRDNHELVALELRSFGPMAP
jgi:outer membrane protein assembly factor BamB